MQVETDDAPAPLVDCALREELCSDDLPISQVALPNGQRKPVLKAVMTSVCERNCNYCAFRSGRDLRRVTFKAEEMAQVVDGLTRAKKIEGAFLSSGITGGGVATQDRILDAAQILREKYHYREYLHLKLMPGAEEAQIERAMLLADRVSVNLEGPNANRLKALAPQKVFFDELLRPLRVVERLRRTLSPRLAWKGRWPSTTTQFVVGAVGENDLELLQTLSWLHREVRLARGYFSGFKPISDTPFENGTPVNQWRVNRLYQASFLLRDYGFDLEDMPFQQNGALPLEVDPKLAWAREHLSEAPVEINQADRRALLRIPGIGPRGAEAILLARRRGKLSSMEELRAIGVRCGRAAPFILLAGRRPSFQPGLF